MTPRRSNRSTARSGDAASRPARSRGHHGGVDCGYVVPRSRSACAQHPQPRSPRPAPTPAHAGALQRAPQCSWAADRSDPARAGPLGLIDPDEREHLADSPHAARNGHACQPDRNRGRASIRQRHDHAPGHAIWIARSRHRHAASCRYRRWHRSQPDPGSRADNAQRRGECATAGRQRAALHR